MGKCTGVWASSAEGWSGVWGEDSGRERGEVSEVG